MSSFRDGPTPVRRSVRIRSVAGSVNESVATTTATASRVAAKRKGPLPKVKTRESQAYGSAGRVGAAEEIQVPISGFAQAFEAQRGNAVARDEDVQSDNASVNESVQESVRESVASVLRNGNRPSLSVAFPPSNNEDDQSYRSTSPDDEGFSPTPSNLDTSKSFGMVHEAGMTGGRLGDINGTSSGIALAHPQIISSARDHQFAVPQRPASSGFVNTPPHVDNNLRHRTTFASSSNRPSALNGPRFAPPTSSQASGLGARPANSQGPLRPVPVNINGARRVQEPVQSHHVRGPQNIRGNGFAPPISTQLEDSEQDSEWLKINPKFLLTVLGALGVIILGIITLLAPPDTMVGALRNRVTYTYSDIIDWVHSPQKSPAVEVPVSAAVSDRVTILERKLRDFDTYLAGLQDFLPGTIVVTRNKNNELEIPDEFWRALAKRMQGEGIPDHSWGEFLRKNRMKLIEVMREDIHRSGFLADTVKAVSKEEFAGLMQQEYNKFARIVDRKVAQAILDVQAHPKGGLDPNVVQNLRIEHLALARLTANQEINLRKVNYFSTGHGATVDPTRSSSTYIGPRSVMHHIFDGFFAPQDRRPHVTAIEKWDEPGECWCAAPDEKGKGLAQLFVRLQHEMIPKQVTIEHLPKQASLDITTAPKTIEFWAESDEIGIDNCSSGPDGWICLGKFEYDIDFFNHVQTFNLDAFLLKPVSKTFLRITGNWGSDHTCLYRIRLHGSSSISEE